jgi:hypothetical protein
MKNSSNILFGFKGKSWRLTDREDIRPDDYSCPNFISKGITWSFHGIFLGLFAMIFESGAELESASRGTWVVFMGSAFLCLFSALYTFHRASINTIPKNVKIWMIVSGLIVSQMILQGLLKTMDDPLHVGRRGIAWIALVFLPILGAPEFRKTLLKLLRYHLIAGVLVVLYVLIAHWEVVTASYVLRQEGMEAKQGKALLYPLYFFMFSFKDISSFMKGIVAAGIIESLIQALVSGTRQAVVILTGVTVMSLWAYMRQRSLNRRGLTIIVSSMVILTFLAGTVVFLRPRLKGAVELTKSRFDIEAGQASLKENTRLDEVKAFLFEAATPLDFLIGRGVTGSWEHVGGLGEQTIHIGYVRLILKGGLPLLLLMLIGPIGTGFRIWLTSRDPTDLAASGMCVWFAAKTLTGNITQAHPIFYLTIISFGICLFLLNESIDERALQKKDSITERSPAQQSAMPTQGIWKC